MKKLNLGILERLQDEVQKDENAELAEARMQNLPSLSV